MTGNRTSALNCGSYRGVTLFLTLETRTTSRTRFHFWLIFKKNTPRKTILYFFAPAKSARLLLLMEVYLSPDIKMIKLLHLTTCFRHYDILAKSREKRVINWRGISRFPPKWRRFTRAYYLVLRKFCPRSRRRRLNPLNPKIKIWILICCPYSFPTEVAGRSL